MIFNNTKNTLLNSKMVKEVYETLSIREIHYEDIQLQLLGWVINDFISMKTIPYLERDSIVKLQSIAITYLYENGFDVAALLLTGERVLDPDGMYCGGSIRKEIIKNNVINELTEIYPYYQEKNSKEKTRQTNIGAVSVSDICNEFSTSDWSLNNHHLLIDNCEDVNHHGALTPPSTLRDHFAKLLIFLNS